jgi:hypothetical protein
MFSDEKMFKYEEPIMSYDKATGNVKIIDPADIKKKRKIINSMDEVQRMKEQEIRDKERLELLSNIEKTR